MRIDNTPWRHVALLTDYASGLTQATRRGDSSSIRAGLRALLATDPGKRREGTAVAWGKESTPSPEGNTAAVPSSEGVR